MDASLRLLQRLALHHQHTESVAKRASFLHGARFVHLCGAVGARRYVENRVLQGERVQALFDRKCCCVRLVVLCAAWSPRASLVANTNMEALCSCFVFKGSQIQRNYPSSGCGGHDLCRRGFCNQSLRWTLGNHGREAE